MKTIYIVFFSSPPNGSFHLHFSLSKNLVSLILAFWLVSLSFEAKTFESTLVNLKLLPFYALVTRFLAIAFPEYVLSFQFFIRVQDNVSTQCSITYLCFHTVILTLRWDWRQQQIQEEMWKRKLERINKNNIQKQ